MQIHTEFREIPGKIYYKNTAKFRVFQKIPYSARSEKSTSVDTLGTTWFPPLSLGPFTGRTR